MRPRIGSFVLVVLVLTGCRDSKRKPSPNDPLYFDYRITADEGDDVTCVFQYRLGGPEGEAQEIKKPGGVFLDGVPLEADSAGFTGIYYEQYIPANEFEGEHTVVYTSPDKKTFTEKFLFQPFNVEEIPEQVHRRPFVIRLSNFSRGKTRVRLLLIDTAFSNNDVINMVDVHNGELHITDRMLRQLKSGPVSMEIYREEERPLKEHTSAGGKIFISYGLQRDFELVD